MKKGFTLVELLAVVVVLGLLFAIAIPFISSSILENEQMYYENQEKMVVVAAESYFNDNYQYLPKLENQAVEYFIDQFKDYLQDEIKGSNSESCTGSYVSVKRIGTNKYDYTPCLICGDYQSPTCG